MYTKNQEQKASMFAGVLFNGMLSVIMGFLLINTLAYYYDLYDIGINNAANSGFLIFIVFPVAILGFFLVSTISFLMLRNISLFKIKKYFLYLTVLLTTLITFALIFDYQLWILRDYPAPRGSVPSFFWKYLLN